MDSAQSFRSSQWWKLDCGWIEVWLKSAACPQPPPELDETGLRITLQGTPLLKKATQHKKITTEIIYLAIKMGPRGLGCICKYYLLYAWLVGQVMEIRCNAKQHPLQHLCERNEAPRRKTWCSAITEPIEWSEPLLPANNAFDIETDLQFHNFHIC